MKIVIINPGVRGPATYSMNLYTYLTKAGHEVLLISEAKWKKEKIPIYQASSYLIFGIVPIVYKPKELINVIRDFKSDVIHYHWPSGTMDLLFGKILNLNIPTVVTIHVAVDSKKFVWDKFFYFYFGIFKKHLQRTDAIVSISEFVENQVIKRTKLPKSESHLIYAGVDSELFKPIKKEKSDKLNVLFVGQIMPEKGIDVLVDAVISANRTRQVNLKIVGEGHLKKILQKKTKGLNFIQWAGFVKEQKSIAEFYQKADLTALPTRWDEGFSLVPVESMFCGTPVLATNKGGTPEIVINNKTGYLIRECSRNEIENVLLSTDQKDLEAYGKNARELILKRHTLEIWGKEHEKLYASLRRKQ
jgi:glycosyltransferase involved in cell wall biosynthesis